MKYSDGVDEADLYALLGVPTSATDAELRRGWREQAKRWHPDRNRHGDAELRMAAINRAYNALSDPVSRGEYDEDRRRRGLGVTVPQGMAPADVVTPAAPPQHQRRGRADGERATHPAGTVRLAAYLRGRGFNVVDNRGRGGVLWIVAKPGVEEVLQGLRGQGLDFEYASSGGLATGNRPAWWTRAWG